VRFLLAQVQHARIPRRRGSVWLLLRGEGALVLPKYLAKCTRQYVTTLQQSSLLCPHLRSRTFDLHINLHMLMPYLLRFFVAQDPMGSLNVVSIY
jgi:hypothetical protein